MTHWLLERLARFPDRDAIVDRHHAMTYRELLQRIEAWSETLASRRLLTGSVIGVQGQASPEVCALFLTLLLSGRVAVPLPASGGERQRDLEIAHVQALVDFGPSAAWSFESVMSSAAPAPLLQRLRERGCGGLVVFSSGSSGARKAALFEVDTLLKRYREPSRGYRSLLFLQLDHLGGIHTLLHALAHGGTAILTADRRPDSVCRIVERYRVELLPTTPTFLRMLVMSGLHDRYDLSSLRLITYGTEPMPSSTLAALMPLFPAVRFKQTYGLSELGVLPTRSRTSDSLWLEVGGVGCEIRVVDSVLWIRSETPMLGYLNAPSPFDQDGWYNTGDLVQVDGSYVRILGRASDVINVGGEKVHPVEVESVLLEIEEIGDATVWGHPSPVTGYVVAARVTPRRGDHAATLERRIYRYCQGRLAPWKIPAYIEIVDGEHHGPRFKKLRARAEALPQRV
jgi:acyl-CoA synthetase (AMP-forming)/AMP-acid ligase II